jgi:Uma2 family endonuclease
MSALPILKVDPKSYLEQERLSEEKHQLIEGEIFAMSGASMTHNLITGNLVRELGNQLKTRPCLTFPSDLRVQVGENYVYPDVSVVCDDPEFSDTDNLLNPKIIIEVLSPSTADYDFGGKFALYRQISSLEEYLLVAQDRPHIVHYTRQDTEHWLLSEWQGLETTITLPSLNVELLLSEIYAKLSTDWFRCVRENDLTI